MHHDPDYAVTTFSRRIGIYIRKYSTKDQRHSRKKLGVSSTEVPVQLIIYVTPECYVRIAAALLGTRICDVFLNRRSESRIVVELN